MYRVCNRSQYEQAKKAVEEFDPSGWEAHPFAYDWMGRVFVLDGRREAAVSMVEWGTGQVLEIPASFIDFHNDELVSFSEAALAESFFNDWRAAQTRSEEPLSYVECVGYRIPLFLGGTDTLENLEIVDAAVYWWLTAQIRRQTIGVPTSTDVRSVALNDSDSD